MLPIRLLQILFTQPTQTSDEWHFSSFSFSFHVQPQEPLLHPWGRSVSRLVFRHFVGLVVWLFFVAVCLIVIACAAAPILATPDDASRRVTTDYDLRIGCHVSVLPCRCRVPIKLLRGYGRPPRAWTAHCGGRPPTISMPIASKLSGHRPW